MQLTIGLLFLSISATVTPSSLDHLVLPMLGLVAVLVVVTPSRPASRGPATARPAAAAAAACSSTVMITDEIRRSISRTLDLQEPGLFR